MMRMVVELSGFLLAASRIEGCRLDTPWSSRWRKADMEAGREMPGGGATDNAQSWSTPLQGYAEGLPCVYVCILAME